MKWLFLGLFSINVMLFVLQWVEYRKDVMPLTYTLPDGVREVALLSERMGAAAGEERCLLLGPVEEEALGRDFVSLLSERGFEANVIEMKHGKAPVYWVYSGPYAADEAGLRLDEYQQKGLDSFVIAQGELKGAISLGVFENIDSARRMIRIVKRHGFEPKMREVKKSVNEYWVSVLLQGSSVSKREIKGLFKGLGVSPEMRQIFCKSVASAK